MDLSVPTGDRAALINAADRVGFGGIGAYKNSANMVHVDGRPSRMSWGPDTTDKSIGQLPGDVAKALYDHDTGAPVSQAAGSSIPSGISGLYNKAAGMVQPYADRAMADINANKGKIAMMTIANMFGLGGDGSPPPNNGEGGDGYDYNGSADINNVTSGDNKNKQSHKDKMDQWLAAMRMGQAINSGGWGWHDAGKDFWDYGPIQLYGQS